MANFVMHERHAIGELVDAAGQPILAQMRIVVRLLRANYHNVNNPTVQAWISAHVADIEFIAMLIDGLERVGWRRCEEPRHG